MFDIFAYEIEKDFLGGRQKMKNEIWKFENLWAVRGFSVSGLSWAADEDGNSPHPKSCKVLKFQRKLPRFHDMLWVNIGWWKKISAKKRKTKQKKKKNFSKLKREEFAVMD